MPIELCEQLLILTSQENETYFEIITMLCALTVAEFGLIIYFYNECM